MQTCLSHFLLVSLYVSLTKRGKSMSIAPTLLRCWQAHSSIWSSNRRVRCADVVCNHRGEGGGIDEDCHHHHHHHHHLQHWNKPDRLSQGPFGDMPRCCRQRGRLLCPSLPSAKWENARAISKTEIISRLSANTDYTQMTLPAPNDIMPGQHIHGRDENPLIEFDKVGSHCCVGSIWWLVGRERGEEGCRCCWCWWWCWWWWW